MKQIILVISLVSLCFTGTCQSGRTDLHEYGFKGNVKVVVKRVYADPPMLNENLLRYSDGAVSVYYYYFNPAGNIDSTTVVHKLSDGEEYGYKTVYRFTEGRKAGWIAVGLENDKKIMEATINWNSDMEFVENVSEPDGKPKYEATTRLNESFRMTRMRIKEYDTSGATIKNYTQDFQMDADQNVIYFKTQHQANGLSDKTSYEYFSKDALGNPLKIVTTNQDTYAKRLILLEYIFY